MLNVLCKCHNRFCRKCGYEPHAPLSCENYESWRARDKGEALLTAQCIKDCKKCPHCGVNTMKDGGCMYMTCSSCRKHWCWQCGKSDHHVWECNRPVYDNSLLDPSEGDMIKYLFYYERFTNHKKSMQVAEQQRIKAAEMARQIDLKE